jgi:hypothetical protein
MENVDIFYGHFEYLGHFMTIWYIFPVLVSCTKKNLAALLYTECSSKGTTENNEPQPKLVCNLSTIAQFRRSFFYPQYISYDFLCLSVCFR